MWQGKGVRHNLCYGFSRSIREIIYRQNYNVISNSNLTIWSAVTG
jgi:hypothetical protein